MRKGSKSLSKELLQEWHSSKNGGINPSTFSSKSRFRPWWHCKSCSHEWQAPLYHRSNGTGCPKCMPKTAWIKHLSSIINTRGSLADQHPQLALEWHPTKNGTTTPAQVAASSGNKFWWKCPKGDDHEWEASASNRAKGKGCSVCAGRKTVLSNCLSTTHPEVAKEWHPAKNGDLKPTEVTFASHKRVWWQCPSGHEWLVSVSNRTSRGKSSCPACLKQEIGQRRVRSLIKRDGSLAEVSPEIAKQWHSEKNGNRTPLEFTAGSKYRAWWKCNKGHEWSVPISARKNHGCPKCTYQTSQLEIRVYCELKVIFPEAIWRERIGGIECDIFLPHHKVAIEIDGFPWHKDREDHDIIKKDFLLNQGITLFRMRDDRLKITGENDVLYKNRESHFQIIVRILGLIKNRMTLSSLESAKLLDYIHSSKLVNEEAFNKMLNDVWTVPEEESIAHLYPSIVLDWDYEKNNHLSPKHFSPGSEMSVYWKCQKNDEHRWKGKINDRVKSRGCPFCTGRRVCIDNSLATLFPHLAAQWDYDNNGGLTPSQVTAGSSREVYWKCDCGSSWKASIWHRRQGGNLGCPNCYNKNIRGKSLIKKAVQKNGSFSDKFPELAKEWHPEKNGLQLPSMLSCGSNIKVWWKCPKGENHEWQNAIVNRIQNPTCPFCCGRRVSIENSFQAWFPELSEEWHKTKNDLSPSEVTKSSGKKIWWLCKKGHEWEAGVISRSRGTGCPFCAGKRASIDENLSSLYPKIATEWHESKNHTLYPSDFRPLSNVRAWWRCSRNPEHEWEAAINSRVNGTGCPFCAGKRSSSSYSLATVNPSLSKEWHPEKNLPLSPADVTPNSGRKVWWKCLSQHEWEASINNRANGRGCPICRDGRRKTA